MALEQDQLRHVEAEKPFIPQIDTFQIKDEASLADWNTSIYPKLHDLFDTTWPEVNTPEFAKYFSFQEAISKPDGAVVLLRDNKANIIGCSFVYSVREYRKDPGKIFYPTEGQTAFNSTVLVAPEYRKQGLMVPLLEETLSQAAELGYDYMVGHYNAATGVMKDGRSVSKGFAYKVKTNPWKNGSVLPTYTRTVFQEGDSPSDNIVFRLNKPQPIGIATLRRQPFPVAAAA